MRLALLALAGPALLPLAGLAILALAAGSHDPGAIDLGRALAPPAPALWLGADHLGRDLAARVAAGAGRSVLVLVLYAAVALPLGLALGLVAAMGGPAARPAGSLLRLGTALPAFVVALAATAFVGLSPRAAGLALGLSGAAQLGLVTAAHARACLRETYVHAAEALGASGGQVMRRHVLPAVAGPLRARLGAGLARSVVAYASLAFVGLGADTGAPDWGAMAWEYRTALFETPRLIVAPVVATAALALACHLLLDPPGRDVSARRRGAPRPSAVGLPARPASPA